MLNKITLTAYGEVLEPYPETEDREDTALSCCIGVHAVCNSWVDIGAVTPLHNALVCRGCKMRIVIPIVVDSWTKLEDHFKLRLKEPDEFDRLRL